mmetsp:Transcript_15901/g.28308  ORF Transcript_15901/g.28308 Transcript_15901/m.28308 type:complete len:107 (+) Transcript_15901:242-562(+)
MMCQIGSRFEYSDQGFSPDAMCSTLAPMDQTSDEKWHADVLCERHSSGGSQGSWSENSSSKLSSEGDSKFSTKTAELKSPIFATVRPLDMVMRMLLPFNFLWIIPC